MCGGSRIPFSTTSLNLAGQPARIGSLAAKTAGCVVAVIGSAAALGLGFLFQTLLAGYAGLAIGLPIAIITMAVATSLFVGGGWLRRAGERRARAAKMDTIRALVAHQKGDITAADAARALRLSTDEADALLTEMAKDESQNVSLDLDDDGIIHYLFGEGTAAKRWRILEERAARLPDLEADPTEAAAEAEAEAEEQAQAGRSSRR